MLYQALKKFVGIFFTVLNFLMVGNLPPFGCVCVIVEREGRFLVVEQTNGRVVFPGGFMRWRESPEQTLRREGQEETGLLMREQGLIGYYPHIAKSIIEMSTLTLVYRGEVVSGTLKKSMEGNPLWISAEELLEKLSPEYHRIFEDYLHYSTEHHEIHIRPL
jgi:ADP-ribose pyrophosphatase YjhB (NUDIX family)